MLLDSATPAAMLLDNATNQPHHWPIDGVVVSRQEIRSYRDITNSGVDDLMHVGISRQASGS